MNNKRSLSHLYKDIVLMTRVRIFCTAFFYQQQHTCHDSNQCLSGGSLFTVSKGVITNMREAFTIPTLGLKISDAVITTFRNYLKVKH